MSTTMRRSLAGLLLLAAPLAVLLTWWAVRADLPDPIATHWSLGGQPDGFSRVGPFVLGITLGALVGAVLGLAMLLVDRPRAGARPLVTMIGWTTWVVATAALSSMLVARGLVEAKDAEAGWSVMLFTLLVPSVIAVALWWLLPAGPPVARAMQVPEPSYRLAEGERATWVGTASSRGLLIAAAVLTVVGAVLIVAVNWWGGVVLAAAFLLGWLHSLTVRVDNDSVTAHFGPWAWPASRTPIERIEAAAVEEVDPLKWGGWGYRLSTRGAALVVRRGPGLVLSRRGGSDLALTVDRPEGAAELINALVNPRVS